MSVPPALGATVSAATGRGVTGGRSVGGGDINDAWLVELEDGDRAFVKTRPGAPAGEYATEAAALRWLAESGGPRVPEVLAVHDPDEPDDRDELGDPDEPDDPVGPHGRDEPDDPNEPDDSGERSPRLLALRWIEPGRLDSDGEAELGRGLAALHAAGAESFGAGPPDAPRPADAGVAPLRIGPLRLPNEPLAGWPAFYAERRLRPLIGPAVDRGALSTAGARAVERVCERLDDLAGSPEPPARLHGDLWAGNVLAAADGRPWLIDPAAYGGHREVDLAMLRLFGAPGPRVIDAYQELHPLASGHEQRVALWQIFPLLVHAVLFGGSYGQSAERAARRYVG